MDGHILLDSMENSRASDRRVLVVESEPALACEITTHLSRIGGVGEVCSVERLNQARERIGDGDFDLVIFDPIILDDPVVDGEWVLDSPKLSCVFFSSLDTARLALARTRIGVAGVVQRAEGVPALCQYVEDVFHGRTAGKVPMDNKKRTRRVILSRQERRAVYSLGQGYTLKETAGRMKINPKTVETYKSRALTKLGISSRAELIGLVAFGRFPDP